MNREEEAEHVKVGVESGRRQCRQVCQLCDSVSVLPPAYVVRREGNSFTLLVCPHLGGYPYPIMLCNITQNAMGQTPKGGYPYPIMLCNISQNAMGQTPGGVPSQGGTLPGPGGGGTLLGGYPGRVHTPPARSGWGGSLPGGGGVPS